MSRQFTLHGNERRFALSLAAVAAVLGIGALSVIDAFGAPAPTASGHRNTALDARRGKSGATRGRPHRMALTFDEALLLAFAPS